MSLTWKSSVGVVVVVVHARRCFSAQPSERSGVGQAELAGGQLNASDLVGGRGRHVVHVLRVASAHGSFQVATFVTATASMCTASARAGATSKVSAIPRERMVTSALSASALVTTRDALDAPTKTTLQYFVATKVARIIGTSYVDILAVHLREGVGVAVA